MKEYILIIAFLILLIGCESHQSMTFQMGIANCKDIYEKKGGKGFYPRVNCLEGYNLPNFKTVSSKNDTIDTNSLLGKPSIINLWFVGCPPCEAEVPGLNQLANKYDEYANFIAIGRNSNQYLTEFLEKNEWNFKHINDPEEQIIKNHFNHNWGFPTTFIANKKGEIVKAFSGGKTDSSAVEAIINEIEPTLIKLINE